MSPENAIVFISEDDDLFQEMAIKAIEASSHKVVVVASTLNEALDGIEKAKQEGVNVAVVDGNLTEDDYSGYDGRKISTELRQQIPRIKIVSFSGNKQSYGDVHVDKSDLRNLGQVITALPE